jgi:hypothetical protein
VIEHSATAQPMAWTMLILASIAMTLFVLLVRAPKSTR